MIEPFDFTVVDDLLPGQRYSPYWDVEKLSRGPQPVPDWLVTDSAAIDTDLGVLKTGKEADCFLIERAVPDGVACILASKRYRGEEHRQFHRSSSYVEGRRTRRSRDARASSARRLTAAPSMPVSGRWPSGMPSSSSGRPGCPSRTR